MERDRKLQRVGALPRQGCVEESQPDLMDQGRPGEVVDLNLLIVWILEAMGGAGRYQHAVARAELVHESIDDVSDPAPDHGGLLLGPHLPVHGWTRGMRRTEPLNPGPCLVGLEPELLPGSGINEVGGTGRARLVCCLSRA